MKWSTLQLALVLLVVALTAIVDAGIKCYVCDTTRLDNDDTQICDDTFLPSRGAKIETGCSACTKERAFSSGIMFIKRDCERSLRWESSVWSCNRDQERDYVFGLPGTSCVCLTDLCNSSSHIKLSLSIPLLTLLISQIFF